MMVRRNPFLHFPCGLMSYLSGFRCFARCRCLPLTTGSTLSFTSQCRSTFGHHSFQAFDRRSSLKYRKTKLANFSTLTLSFAFHIIFHFLHQTEPFSVFLWSSGCFFFQTRPFSFARFLCFSHATTHKFLGCVLYIPRWDNKKEISAPTFPEA